MGKPIDLTNQRFGAWTVLHPAPSPAGHEHQCFWLCRCDCGTETVQKTGQLRYQQKRGVKQSCNRCAAVRHGQTGTPIHRIWIQMHDRCRRPAHHAYANYGGRGISVCERWNVFENFVADMGARPSAKHSLDRIDGNLGYSPENCRWATSRKQNRNRRSNRLLTFNGKTQCLAEWSEETGLGLNVIKQRLDTLGWSIEEALSIPATKACNWRGTTHKDAGTFAFNGEQRTLREWSALTGIKLATIRSRLGRGWPVERALSHR